MIFPFFAAPQDDQPAPQNDQPAPQNGIPPAFLQEIEACVAEMSGIGAHATEMSRVNFAIHVR